MEFNSNSARALSLKTLQDNNDVILKYDNNTTTSLFDKTLDDVIDLIYLTCKDPHEKENFKVVLDFKKFNNGEANIALESYVKHKLIEMGFKVTKKLNALNIEW